MASVRALNETRRKIRRGQAIRAGANILTPIVLEELGAGMVAGACWIHAAKRPLAVIVSGPDGRRLVRLEGSDRAKPE